jgi:hypothetical protein
MIKISRNRKEGPQILSRNSAYLAAFVWLVGGVFCAAQEPTEPVRPDGARIVPAAELVEVMRLASGYNVTRSTNATRFLNETLLRLARRAQRTDPEEHPLFINHRDWFLSLLQVTGLSTEEVSPFSRLAFEHKQDVLIDYRRDRVIRSNGPESSPDMALNVRCWWPAAPGAAKSFSAVDTQSVPKLRVTNMRVITYRLLDFGDMLVCDRIHGLRGKPVSGVLGIMFRLIGEGAVVSSRMAISNDNLQIIHAHSRKYLMKLRTTASVHPDGHAEKGIPKDRPDLAATEVRLRRRLTIEYAPLETK